jgi:hypothetical protein
MSIKKIKPKSPDLYLGKTIGDNTLARLAHVNYLIDEVNSIWTLSGSDIYNSNIGNVGIGGAPSGTHKFEVVGGIKTSDEASFQGITLRNKDNAIAIGSNSILQNVIPTGSLFVGGYAGGNVTGGGNTAIGFTAMYNATAPIGCVAVGWSAMRYRTAGNYNTAVGYNAMGDGVATGASNTAIGRNSLTNMTTGTQNTCVGQSTGAAILGGSYNTLLGYLAGSNLTEGLRNIIIGQNISASAVSVNDELNIGNWIKGTAGQIGIGGALPASCAMLDVASTTKGFLLPRMTKTQRDLIGTPVAGLAVYQTDNTPGLRVYNGTNWVRFTETID